MAIKNIDVLNQVTISEVFTLFKPWQKESGFSKTAERIPN